MYTLVFGYANTCVYVLNVHMYTCGDMYTHRYLDRDIDMNFDLATSYMRMYSHTSLCISLSMYILIFMHAYIFTRAASYMYIHG